MLNCLYFIEGRSLGEETTGGISTAQMGVLTRGYSTWTFSPSSLHRL